MQAEEILALDWDKTASLIAKFICKEVKQRENDGAIIGLSGGLDSAVTAALAREALGPSGIKGVILPERDTDPQSVRDAHQVARRLGIPIIYHDLTGTLRKLGIYRFVPPGAPKLLGRWDWLVSIVPRQMKEKYVQGLFQNLSRESGGGLYLSNLRAPTSPILRAGLAFIRAKVRMRMVALYFYAEQENRLLLGTSNRTEWLIGLFVPQGDGAADVMPILDLYKTQVRGLARHLGVPQGIIDKAPSPDVAPGITDEYAIGLPYAALDLILYGLEMGWEKSALLARTGASEGQIEEVRKMVALSDKMRHLPPYPQVRPI